MSRKIDLRKKERILETAKVLFAKYDYDMITIDKIAEIAGIAKGTIYIYFSNKDEIFYEIMENSSRSLRTRISEIIENETDFFLALNNVINSIFGFFREHIDTFRIMRKTEMNAGCLRRKKLTNKIQSKMRTNQEAIFHAIAGIFRLRNVPSLKMEPYMLARYLVALVFSSINLLSVLDSNTNNIRVGKNSVEKIADMFLYGIVKNRKITGDNL